MNQDLMVFFCRDNLQKIKDEAYVRNLDEYSNIGTYWVTMYMQNNNNNVTYFDSFGVEHILTEIKAFIKDKNINVQIFLYWFY